MKTSFQSLLEKYRNVSFSERDKGDRFERLIQAYLLTDPFYENLFKKVWLWNEFPAKEDLGGNDTGIDLVALTNSNEYWAIQCKCYREDAIMIKAAVDTFLSTSGRKFKNEKNELVGFSQRLWIETTGKKWSANAEEAIKNQYPPLSRLNLFNLIDAPVDWGKLDQGISGELSRTPKKELRPHQRTALENAHDYFKIKDRGKLIMACGTGKTFNSLRIAEHETNGKGFVLFLVPSIALLGQSLREWSSDAKEKINAICICSDPEVTRKKTKNEDIDNFSIVDLALPASTNVQEILKQFSKLDQKTNQGLTVVFSTYQSIDVISKAQKELSKQNERYSEFDLIICDEAHRTTGVTLSGEDESAFTKVHNNNFIKGKKRLYMTATPRLYNEDTKSKAAQLEAVLCSMDDPDFFGEEIYRIGFGEAVERDLLTDYKVLILTLNQNDIPPSVQSIIKNKENEINTDDVSKLIGCINALSKQILGDEGIVKDTDPSPMKRAVAFCQNIKTSEKITETFNTATDAYLSALPGEKKGQMVTIASKHIDGTFSAPERDELLAWLKADAGSNECRVLTNVRCLSEGVDVPSLDAVMFLSARNSQVDVVQSVGRVMRKSPGKKYGYIIIPVVVPTDVEADKALDDNERYKVVWTVLNALRAHDDRFNATVNKIELNKKRPEQILVARPEYTWEDGVTIVADPEAKYTSDFGKQLAIKFEQLQSVVFARMVQKVGDRRYWEQWAGNVADIAKRHVERIEKLVVEDEKHRKAFDTFLNGLQKNINPSITVEEAVDMLSQHIITKPVFEALFEDYSFVKNNPISVSMQKMLDLLEEQTFEKDAETLKRFYDSVKMRAAGIDNAAGRQSIIIELYDKFFKTAFPKMVEKLGIVYTPIEIVDFIIASVNDVLKKEFGKNLSDEGVNILDPFTGTGTFITRLLQSGLIDKKDLARKYKDEIFANEMVLLAYYIAAINIENAYHEIIGQKEYETFEGICLTDTFQLGESKEGEDLFSEMFENNSKRVQKQLKTKLQVIIGNPPYSVGQKSANDNAQNQSYPKLEKRIEETYIANVDVTQKRSLYDSYIKAFRWSTDKLDPKNGGIICFVSNGAWLDGNASSGFRKSIAKEFTSIYVFNLRGNQRTSGELSKKEGGKIFGSGSRTPITITLLVKQPDTNTEHSKIYYKDIGDYHNREEKLRIIADIRSFGNVDLDWKLLSPNQEGDWINLRNRAFENYIPLGDEKTDVSKSFFTMYANGLQTSRDSWIYNSSKEKLTENIKNFISFYNNEKDRISKLGLDYSKVDISDFLDNDPAKISWSGPLKNNVKNKNEITFKDASIKHAFYRPYTEQFCYYNKDLNDVIGSGARLYPTIEENFDNKVICVSGVGASKDFSALITKQIVDRQFMSNGQCFPLFFYQENKKNLELFANEYNGESYTRHDAISNFIIEQFKKQYGSDSDKEDIFYYVYGFLHSPDYREIFANDLKKMLPRLPLVDDVKDFWAFSKAGRKLAELHLNYETIPAYEGIKITGTEKRNYKVEKMRFPKKGQKDTIIYNGSITIENIPEKAYEYIVNGKSAIEWIMERYQITTHKESGITNDPNDWADKVGNPRYILDLLLSIINVSVQTVDIVNGLPKVKFE
jgi:predicted helicase